MGEYTDESMIDTIVNNRKTVTDVKGIPSELLNSDHRIVVEKLRLMRPRKSGFVARERLAVEKLKEEGVKEFFFFFWRFYISLKTIRMLWGLKRSGETLVTEWRPVRKGVGSQEDGKPE